MRHCPDNRCAQGLQSRFILVFTSRIPRVWANCQRRWTQTAICSRGRRSNVGQLQRASIDREQKWLRKVFQKRKLPAWRAISTLMLVRPLSGLWKIWEIRKWFRMHVNGIMSRKNVKFWREESIEKTKAKFRVSMSSDWVAPCVRKASWDPSGLETQKQSPFLPCPHQPSTSTLKTNLPQDLQQVQMARTKVCNPHILPQSSCTDFYSANRS